MAKIYDKIREKLEAALHPEYLEILDESDKHKGHTGARPGGETHFAVTIIVEKFVGMSRIERHKLVHSILKAELESGVHALSIKALAAGEK